MLKTKPDYFLTEVDGQYDTIYCAHSLMGEKDIPAHQHFKSQFLYVEGGVVYVDIAKKTYLLPPRHYMWIPAGIIHSIHPGSPGVTMRNLYFPKKNLESEFYNTLGIYPVNDLVLQMICFSNRWNGNIDVSDGTSFHFAIALKGVLPEISPYRSPLAIPFARDKRLVRITKFMKANLSEPLAFLQIAQKFGLSERTLSRLFKDDTGFTFSQYFTLVKVIGALQLLPEGKSVKEVATAVGYSSVPTFSNTFYKLLGVRPSLYLNNRDVLE